MVYFWMMCLLLMGSSQSVADMCTNHQQFTNRELRSTKVDKFSLGDRYIKEGWYGTKYFIIPYTSPGLGHCGTFHAIYLKEKPSTSGNIQTITACAQGANGCEFEIDIQVKYCDPSLTVYKLSRVPSDYAAYCLGSEFPDFPDFKTRPLISYTLQDKGPIDQEYEILCGFSNPRNPALVFKTEWFVNGISVYESNFTDYEDTNKERALTDTRLNAAGITVVGFKIYCEIRAGFRSTHASSFPSQSISTFIGIEVKDKIVNVKEGGEVTVYIRPTWMLGCHSGMRDCNLSVTVVTPDESECLPSTEIKGSCGIKINPRYWNRWNPIIVTPDVTLDRGLQTITQRIYLSTNKQHFFHPIWASYQIPPIKVVILKNTSAIEGRVCKIVQDPYLEDFKNRYMRFDLGGVFILYQAGIAEIQVQVTECKKGASGYCVCGTIVRVGRTVFMVNHCNSNYWFIDYILCDDGGDVFDVKKIDSNSFEISLPSGTKAKLNMRQDKTYYWMGIDIIPSIRDYGKTSGLCNNLTNDGFLENQDLRWWSRRRYFSTDVQYFNTWKLSPSNKRNLFVADNLDNVNVLQTSGKFRYCNCNTLININDQIQCKTSPSTRECASDNDSKNFNKKKCTSPSRKKRSIPTLKNSHTHKRRKRDVSWKNGWTENSANEYCIGLFNNSQAIEICNGLKGLDIGGAVQSCIMDIQLSGTDVFALSSISSVSSQCLSEARMNKTLREIKVKDNKSILKIVEEVSCHMECSGRGRCDKGKCICNSGYIGSGCSLPFNEPPLAHNLQANGHCDLSEDDCTEVAVFGGSFVDHNQTKCKLVSFKIKNNQMIVSEEQYITTAIFESIGEVTCILPSKRSVEVPVTEDAVTGYKVSVANNGQNYSQELNFFIYNTECMNCSTDNVDNMVCSFSTNHCITDNACYSHDSTYNIGDTKYLCRADSNGKAWDFIPEACRSRTQDYSPFTNVNQRLVTNRQSGLSDRFFREGWYGSKNYIIPNSPPGLFHCGTTFPIYLKESPTFSGNVENITACIQGNTVCDSEIQIQAIVCSPTLTVYNLLRPSLDSAAYCLDHLPLTQQFITS